MTRLGIILSLLAATAAPAQPLPPPPGDVPLFTPGLMPVPERPGPRLTPPPPPTGEWPVPPPGTTPTPPRPTPSLGERLFPTEDRMLRLEEDLSWQANALLRPELAGDAPRDSPSVPAASPGAEPMISSLMRQLRAHGHSPPAPEASPRTASAPRATLRDPEDARAVEAVPFFDIAGAVPARVTLSPPAAPEHRPPEAPAREIAPMASLAPLSPRSPLPPWGAGLLGILLASGAAAFAFLWRRVQ